MFLNGLRSIKTNISVFGFAIYCFFCSNFSKAQNTLSYTDTESHFRNGVVLFENKVYAAAREEFRTFIKQSQHQINPNEFNIITAEYYAALSGLYMGTPDSEIDIERFVLNHAEHPKAKIIYADLGNYYYDRRDYNKAVIYFEKALKNAEANEQTAELQFRLAISYFNKQELDKALKYFNLMKETAGENAAAASYYAGTINFRKEIYADAIADFKRIENSNTYRSEVPNWIAHAYYRQKQYDALLTYTEAILASPQGRKLDEISLLTAEVSFFQNKYEKAAKYYDQYLNYKRTRPANQVIFRHGYSQMKANNCTGASENFKKIAAVKDEIAQQAAFYLGICSLKSQNLSAAAAAFDQARKTNFNPAITEEAQFTFAKTQIDLGNSQIGINELNDFLKKYPDSRLEDEANEVLSEAYFGSNNYAEAISYIEKLKRRTPKTNATYQRLCYNQGVNDFNAERFKGAILYFDKSLENPTDNDLKTSALFWKAEALYAQKESDDAATLYNQALSAGSEDLKQKSRYSLGYLYYNAKEYGKALSYFREFVNKGKKETTNRQHFEDATVRLADCLLATKNYDEAMRGYDQAIAQNKSDKDYAYYQKGLALMLLGREQEAKSSFDKVSSQFPNSRYADDAMYQLGVLDLEKGNYQVAIGHFTKLLREKPKSYLVPNTLLKRAVAYSNVNKNEEAIADFKKILTQYGNSPVAENALLGLQESLNAAGRSDEFAEFLAEYKRKNPQSGSVEGLEFETAKNLYLNEKYDRAITFFLNYMTNYPSSNLNYEAKFYLADSYYRNKDNQNALRYFGMVLADNKTNFVSRAAARAGEIEYGQKNYSKAITFYRALMLGSTNKKDQVNAYLGLMNSYYATSKYDSTQFYAREIINSGNIVLGASNKALLINGKVFLAKGDYANADAEFKKTIAAAKDINGAEAKYLVGDILYKTKKYQEAIKYLQEFGNDFGSFVDWYDKAILLIADNYTALQDYFMARATLNSIIENAENKEIIATAKAKLKSIEGK